MKFAPELFEPLYPSFREFSRETRAVPRRRAGFWRRFLNNRSGRLGLVMVLIVVTATLVGPEVWHRTYWDQELSKANLPPSLEHPLGTDMLGRDLLARVLCGARVSLSVGFVASLINLVIGVLYGGISALAGGKTDTVMMGIIDIIYGIPMLLVVIMLMVVLQQGLLSVFVALGLCYWVGMARIVRGEILSLKEREFVLAARGLGAGPARILFRHLLPNCAGPVLVTLTLRIPQAIFLEAFLSYIGLGVSAPMASWGVLASEGAQSIGSYPWQIFFPSAAIAFTMLGFNFLGDGLRDAFDPHQRGRI